MLVYVLLTSAKLQAVLCVLVRAGALQEHRLVHAGPVFLGGNMTLLHDSMLGRLVWHCKISWVNG